MMPCRAGIVTDCNHIAFLVVYVLEIEVQSGSDGCLVGIRCRSNRLCNRLNGWLFNHLCYFGSLITRKTREDAKCHQHKHKNEQHGENHAKAHACTCPCISPNYVC